METVPRVGWQHPGSRDTSPPCGSRRARVGEPGSRAFPRPPLVSQHSGEESGIISSAAPLPFGSIPPLPSPSVPSLLEHPSLLQPRLPTLEDLYNTNQSEWKIGDVQPGSTARPGMGWAGGHEQRGERQGGEWRAAALRPCCIAQRCRSRHRAWCETGGRCRGDPLGIYYNLLFLRRWAARAGSQLGQVPSAARPSAAVWTAPTGLSPRPPRPPPGVGPPGTPGTPSTAHSAHPTRTRDARGWTSARASPRDSGCALTRGPGLVPMVGWGTTAPISGFLPGRCSRREDGNTLT